MALAPNEHARYCLMVDGETFPVETYERDVWGSGAILAAKRAAELSVDAGTVRLYVGERYLATYVRGRWAPRGGGVDASPNGSARG